MCERNENDNWISKKLLPAQDQNWILINIQYTYVIISHDMAFETSI